MESPYTPRRSSTDTVQFRIICPSIRTGAVIGKGGSSVRHIQSLTGAKIRLLDDPHGPPAEDRVILITSHNHHFSSKNPKSDDEIKTSQEANEGDTNSKVEGEEENLGPVQKALVRVFEKVIRGDSEEEVGDGVVVSGKFLVGSNQMGSFLKVIDKIQGDTGSQIVVLPREQVPPCAFPGDELVMVTGSFTAVRKSLVAVSNCIGTEAANSGHTESSGAVPQGDIPQRGYGTGDHASEFHSRGYSYGMGPENTRGHNRIIEEDIVFRLLCQQEKVGSLIGKGGAVVRAIENDTGAFIKIADHLRDSDERVVVISARENSEMRHSPAQDAVIRVQTRIAEIGFDATVVARLVVPQQQIGFLLGKGGHVVAEIRQLTGAGIRIFPKEQAPKYGSQNHEIVQVVGGLQCVQDALFHITSRLREFIFPIKPFSGNAGPLHPPPFPDMHNPQFMPGPNPASPGSYPPVGPFHSNPIDHPSAYPYGVDSTAPPNLDHGPYPFGGERPIHGPPFECSPRSWNPQPFGKGNHRRPTDYGPGLDARNEPLGSGCQPPDPNLPVEIVIPQKYLAHVYGENNSNLNEIRQMSGANVVVQEPKPGHNEGLVVLSGSPAQMHIAQSLVHAFILLGKTISSS